MQIQMIKLFNSKEGYISTVNTRTGESLMVEILPEEKFNKKLEEFKQNKELEVTYHKSQISDLYVVKQIPGWTQLNQISQLH